VRGVGASVKLSSMKPRLRLLPRRSPSLTDVATQMVVRDGDGRVLARAEGARTPRGPRWTWRSATFGTFGVEPVGDEPPRWLLTRGDGFPVGQLEVRAALLGPQLEVSDGRGLHLIVTASGTVRTPDRRAVARLRRTAAEETVLDLDGRLPAAWRNLLVAASPLIGA
jgi:hypothetical protein